MCKCTTKPLKKICKKNNNKFHGFTWQEYWGCVSLIGRKLIAKFCTVFGFLWPASDDGLLKKKVRREQKTTTMFAHLFQVLEYVFKCGKSIYGFKKQQQLQRVCDGCSNSTQRQQKNIIILPTDGLATVFFLSLPLFFNVFIVAFVASR